MRNLMRQVPATAGLALLIILAGCQKRHDETVANRPGASDSSHQGQSMVRVVNVVPEEATIDVYADDANAFSGVAFKTITPFHALRDNMIKFQIRSAGSPAAGADTTKPLAENRELLSDGDRYTVVALPGDSIGDSPKLKVLEEPNDAGNPGMARVRFVNAARGVDKFDVFLPGQKDPFFDDVGFGGDAGYKDIDSATVALQIRANDSRTVLLTLPRRNFTPGKTYTFIITKKGHAGRQLDFITVEDEAASPSTMGSTPKSPADSSGTHRDSTKSY